MVDDQICPCCHTKIINDGIKLCKRCYDENTDNEGLKLKIEELRSQLEDVEDDIFDEESDLQDDYNDLENELIELKEAILDELVCLREDVRSSGNVDALIEKLIERLEIINYES